MVSEELVDVVEVPSAAVLGRAQGAGFGPPGQRMDENELFQERATGVEHDYFERFEVGEFTKIGSGSFEDVAEKAADGSRLVRVLAASYAHLKQDARADQRRWLTRGG